MVIGADGKFLIFTDLDGTLMDSDTYGWEMASPAIEECKRRYIPIIIVSSKTRAEIIKIREILGLRSPFVSENGGGIYFDPEEASPPEEAIKQGGFFHIPVGVPHDVLVQALKEISAETGHSLRGFSDMTPEEVSSRTGLDIESARRALMREYDEPFIIMDDNPDINQITKSAQKRNLSIIKGGRFFHLKGNFNKGDAVLKIINWYSERYHNPLSVALGDGPNDISMLERVDIPVLVKSPFNVKGMASHIKNLIITDKMGPEGWNEAVLKIIG